MCELKQIQTALLLVNPIYWWISYSGCQFSCFNSARKKSRPRFPCAFAIDPKCESGESQNFAQLSFQRSLSAFLKGPDRCSSLRGKSPQSGRREALLAKNFPGSLRDRNAEFRKSHKLVQRAQRWRDWGCPFRLTRLPKPGAAGKLRSAEEATTSQYAPAWAATALGSMVGCPPALARPGKEDGAPRTPAGLERERRDRGRMGRRECIWREPGLWTTELWSRHPEV